MPMRGRLTGHAAADRMTLSAEIGDDDFCYITTRGRITGRPHEIEIWFVLDGTTVFVLSGGGDRSDWVRNLIADPAVRFRLRDVTSGATARVVEPASDEDARARRLVFEKYQDHRPSMRSISAAESFTSRPGRGARARSATAADRDSWAVPGALAATHPR